MRDFGGTASFGESDAAELGRIAEHDLGVATTSEPDARNHNQVFHYARVDIPSSIVETTSIMTLLSLIQKTDMLGVTPVSVVEDYPGRDLLAVLPIKFEARLPPYGLITRRHRIQSSATQAFMSSVRADHAR